MKSIKWNLSKEGGWNNYLKLTDEYSEKVDKIVENDDLTIEQKYKKFEDLHNKIKFKAFGKVTLKTSNEQPWRGNNEETEDEKKERMWKEQEKVAEQEIQESSALGSLAKVLMFIAEELARRLTMDALYSVLMMQHLLAVLAFTRVQRDC